MRFLALAIHPQEGHSRTDIARFLKVSRTSVNKWVSNFLLHGGRGWIVSVHQGDPPSSARTAIPASEYIDQQSRLAIGDDCKVLIFKRISSGSLVWPIELSNVYRLPRELGFPWITSRSRHPEAGWAGAGSFKTSSWKRSLTSRVMLRLPMSMSGFRTKPGLVNKIHYPTVGQARQSPPSYSATTIRVRLSLRCRLPCNRDNGSLAQSPQ